MLDNKQIEGIAQLKSLLPHLQEENAEACGVWLEHSFSFIPDISYEDWVYDMMGIAHKCGLIIPNYLSILETYKIKSWNDIADYESMPEELALAVLSYIIRSEHFSEGSIQDAIRDGALRKTVERLVAIAGI